MLEDFFDDSDKFFDGFFDDFGDSFKKFFGRNFAKALPYDDKSLIYRTPRRDLQKIDKDKIKLEYEIPGIEDKKDIQLTVRENYIKVKVEREKESEEKKKNYYKKERSSFGFLRIDSLPYEVDADKVNATYKNGVLEVILQKSEKEKQPKKLIEIK